MPKTPPAVNELACCRLSNPWEALGLAAHLLHASKPFADYTFDKLVATLRAQIKRDHYLFTLQNQEVVGYVGWALCIREVADNWVERAIEPRLKDCLEGDHWVPLTWHASRPSVVRAQARHLRGIYPDKIGVGRRDYGGGRTRVKRFTSFSSDADSGATS